MNRKYYIMKNRRKLNIILYNAKFFVFFCAISLVAIRITGFVGQVEHNMSFFERQSEELRASIANQESTSAEIFKSILTRLSEHTDQLANQESMSAEIFKSILTRLSEHTDQLAAIEADPIVHLSEIAASIPSLAKQLINNESLVEILPFETVQIVFQSRVALGLLQNNSAALVEKAENIVVIMIEKALPFHGEGIVVFLDDGSIHPIRLVNAQKGDHGKTVINLTNWSEKKPCSK